MTQPSDRQGGRIGGAAWPGQSGGAGGGEGIRRPRQPGPDRRDRAAGAQSAAAPPMSMVDAIRAVYSKPFTFSGRARRAEYWWYMLFYVLVSFVLGFVEVAAGISPDADTPGPISSVFALANFLPGLAVNVRRLHDVGRSGWWLLAPAVPAILAISMTAVTAGLMAPIGMILLIGTLVIYLLIFVWTVTRSHPGTNRFGPSPLEQ
ncbi:Uncharacterized membrane protein YhaH, DUF805 family [Paracoccus isoporae]|uniref:Uncharacterized membrane protein YhaH, DUF805 family n=1 Tax=Paracoccus isoporae TaxID=591205 RepID=A0A1G7A6Z9_9RHOB|nr:DUF805 domain-containing protein [Paracoccus isoporae]SDE10453.1 Uncharacterized membrane protein YhaH, DUF805 family [Paracoccus isoporae]